MHKSWTPQQEQILRLYYPTRGLKWCAKLMDRPPASIRQKASRLGLKQDRQSEFFKDWQKRAAESKIGKKRPDQAKVMARLHAEGKIQLTEEGRRKIGASAKKRIAEQGHPRGALGLKHTEETKLLIGQKSKLAWESMPEENKVAKIDKMMKTRIANGTVAPPRKASWKAGWRVIGGVNKYYRSGWEANYARYLEWLKGQQQIAAWKHEPTTFWFEGIKRGTRSYLPDFWVQANDGSECYHEVKGWMDSKSKTKLKRMSIYHPTVKIVLIDKKSYQALAKSISTMIPDWE